MTMRVSRQAIPQSVPRARIWGPRSSEAIVRFQIVAVHTQNKNVALVSIGDSRQRRELRRPRVGMGAHVDRGVGEKLMVHLRQIARARAESPTRRAKPGAHCSHTTRDD